MINYPALYHNLPVFIFFAFFFLILGRMIFKIITKGGFQAMLFDSRIVKTVGSVSGPGSRLMDVSLTVYQLDGAPDKTVGLSLTAKSVGSFQTLPISLSLVETRNLIALLQQATEGISVDFGRV
jgi:hypothetical protein